MSLKEFAGKSPLRPWGVLITLLPTVLSSLPVMIFGLQQNTTTAKKEAVLRVDGTEIKIFPLTAGEKDCTCTYKDEHGDYNLIEIDDDRIRIREVDCDDQICIRRGQAIKNGETIVRLPHKLVIKARSINRGDEDDLIY